MEYRQIYQKFCDELKKNRPTSCECCGATLPTGDNSGVQVFFFIDDNDHQFEMSTCRDCRQRGIEYAALTELEVVSEHDMYPEEISVLELQPIPPDELEFHLHDDSWRLSGWVATLEDGCVPILYHCRSALQSR